MKRVLVILSILIKHSLCVLCLYSVLPRLILPFPKHTRQTFKTISILIEAELLGPCYSPGTWWKNWDSNLVCFIPKLNHISSPRALNADNKAYTTMKRTQIFSHDVHKLTLLIGYKCSLC